MVQAHNPPHPTSSFSPCPSQQHSQHSADASSQTLESWPPHFPRAMSGKRDYFLSTRSQPCCITRWEAHASDCVCVVGRQVTLTQKRSIRAVPSPLDSLPGSSSMSFRSPVSQAHLRVQAMQNSTHPRLNRYCSSTVDDCLDSRCSHFHSVHDRQPPSCQPYDQSNPCPSCAETR